MPLTAEATVGSQLSFRILGPLEVDSGDRPVQVGGRRQRTILAVLLLERNRVVPVSTLVRAVWGECAPNTAREQVQNGVWMLRRALPPGAVVTRSCGYLVNASEDDLDADAFMCQVGQARAAAGSSLPAAVWRLRHALALWRGPMLAEIPSPVVQAYAAQWEEIRLSVLEERMDLELQAGRHSDLVGELLRLVAEHPLRERLTGQLMVALLRSGRRAEALEVYLRGRRTMVDQVGIEPGAGLRQLHSAILAGTPASYHARAAV